MFGGIAARYDLLNHLLSANQDKRWRRRGISQLAPRRGERILDLCCGTGDLAMELRRQQPHCRVIGADFAIPMLQIAAEKANSGGKTAVPFLAGDALQLPFADTSFDAATVAYGARNFENTRTGLAEMLRVVKPGGRILVLEFMRPTSPLLRFGFGLFFKNVLPLIGKAISKHGSAYNYLPASVDEFYTRREFEVLMREVGWTNVRSFDFSGGISSSFIAQRPLN